MHPERVGVPVDAQLLQQLLVLIVYRVVQQDTKLLLCSRDTWSKPIVQDSLRIQQVRLTHAGIALIL